MLLCGRNPASRKTAMGQFVDYGIGESSLFTDHSITPRIQREEAETPFERVIASHGPRLNSGLSMEETPSPLRGRALRHAQGRELVERGRGEGVLKSFTLPFIPSRRGRGNERAVS